MEYIIQRIGVWGEIGTKFQLYLDVSVYSSNWLVVDIPVCRDMS